MALSRTEEVGRGMEREWMDGWRRLGHNMFLTWLDLSLNLSFDVHCRL